MKKIFLTLILTSIFSCSLLAQKDGGISPELLQSLKEKNVLSPTQKALQHALSINDINKLSMPLQAKQGDETHFSHKINTKGISDQKSSGRCWLFTGLNVMRAKAIAEHHLGSFQFSQVYVFFFDQLEKSNLFLQAVIDDAQKPMNDKRVEWLFKHPLSDGGQFTGVSDLISKYGVVPADAMPETYNSNNTSHMSSILKTKLRQYGLELRKMSQQGAKMKAITQRKEEMLSTVYHILKLCLGTPPTEFTWTRCNVNGKPVETKTYTPLEFYKEYVGLELTNNYVMLMNDPTRDYYKTYEIDLDRHTYNGNNWKFVNVPMEEIKASAIASIKDSVMMYLSCDVGKFFIRETGILDLKNFDYSSLFSTDFPMNKAERISSFASGSTHAMTLMAVDLDKNGKAKKWMVENSWGNTGYKGHVIMTDEWFDNYLFRLVIEKRFASNKILKALEKDPILLPAWDPLFKGEE